MLVCSELQTYNQTQFILLGFPLTGHSQTCVFMVLLLIYIVALLCNLIIIAAVILYQQLKTPMYYFLCSLASLDICFISSTIPQVLSSMMSDNHVISQSGCFLQFYFYVSIGGAEFYHLALMSVDRYLAICHPLKYSMLMTNQLSWKLIIFSWLIGFLELIPVVFLLSRLQWCNRFTIINHFFCDGSFLLYLSCSDTYVAEHMFLGVSSFVILSSFMFTLGSYCFILTCVFSISSSSGRRKTFSTCSSHFFVVLMAYGSCIFIYVRPAGTMSSSREKTVALFNSVLSPLLNPFIYTLRNQTFKNIFKDLLRVKEKCYT